MKATKTLIHAFRKVARRLRNETLFLNWSQPCQCNCGLLIRELLNMNEVGLAQAYNRFVGGPWKNVAREAYNKSNYECVPELFQELEKHGLEQQDYEAIESLDDPTVYQENPHAVGYALKVADWFEAKADELEIRKRNEHRKTGGVAQAA